MNQHLREVKHEKDCIYSHFSLSYYPLSDLAACATFQPFNHSYVRKFRRELMNSYSCIDEFEIKIGYGGSLVVDCKLQEDTEYELASEIYQLVTEFVCTQEVVDDYLDVIGANFDYEHNGEPIVMAVGMRGQIKLGFCIGTDPREKHFFYDLEFYESIEGEEYPVDIYSGFPGWPEEYSALPEF